MLSISLIVPCYNDAHTLGAVLAGARRQILPPDEVMVVDDGSDDDTAAVARRAGARLERHEQNLGLAAARNTGLSRATGDVVVFVDADAVPHPDLVRRLTAGYEDPCLAAVGGQVLEVGAAGAVDRWRAAFWRQTQGQQALESAPFVVGACCSLRRAAVQAAGGFDPGFCTNGEDVDSSVRLRRDGLRLAYDPRAVVFHARRDTLRSLLSMVYRHSRDHVLALRAGGEPVSPVLLNAARWGPVSLVSSLRRHSSPALSGLSILCHGASVVGCVVGLAGGSPSHSDDSTRRASGFIMPVN